MSSFAAGTPQHSTLWLVVRCSRRATRQRCGHRHAGAVRRTSVSLAFCCPRTCVRGQHLIVPPTNAATAAARMQPQTCTKNSTNPSHLSSKQTPHISHSPVYKNTNPSHFPLHTSPTVHPPPLQPSPSIYIYKPLTFHTPRLPADSTTLPRLPVLGPPLPAPGSRLPAPGSRLPAPGSRSHPRPCPTPQRCPYARIHHHHKPQLPCPHCIFVSTSARARSCPVLAASHPRQRLPRASIHPAPACAGKRREERDLLCDVRLIGYDVSSMRRGDCRFCTPAFRSLVRVVRRVRRRSAAVGLSSCALRSKRMPTPKCKPSAVKLQLRSSRCV